MERLPQMLALRSTTGLAWLRAVPLVLTVVMVPLELLAPGFQLAAVIFVMPAFAALVNGPEVTAVVAVASAVACVVLESMMVPRMPEGRSQLPTVLLIGAASVVIALLRDRVIAKLVTVDTVAQAAQRALLPDLPERVAGLECAVEARAAAAESRLGGDFYDLHDTPWGVRAVIGDVSGHGLGAVATTAALLGSFREGVLDDFDLHGLGVRLERRMRLRNEERAEWTEEFATALLMAFAPDGTSVEVRSFGHHPPLLLRGNAVEPVRLEPAPPLGLMGEQNIRATAAGRSLRPGDMIVAYTDGLVEARDRSGRQYPLLELLRRRLDAAAPFAGPDAVVAFLFDDVHDRGYRITDDAAAIALRVRGV